jgi:hypothetical protein
MRKKSNFIFVYLFTGTRAGKIKNINLIYFIAT